MHKLLDRKDEGVRERPPAQKRSYRGVVLGLLAVAFAALLWWLQSRAATEAPPRRSTEPANVVRIDAVTRGDVSVSLEALGTVTALSTVVVKTQISGKITEVGFVEGQSVKKDDFLVQIDQRPYQAALDQALGQLARDEALLAAARLDLARYEKLMTQDSIARQQVDTQRALVTQDEAIVRSDKANVENATLNLNYCRIVSPSTGRVGLRLVDPGNYVQPNDPNGVVVITQMQPISVIFTLPQDDIPKFIHKLRVGAELPVYAFNRNSTQQLATGKLATIDNQIDTSTGTVKLRAIFANEDETLFPNQFVNVKLVVDTLHGATTVPIAAVQIGAHGSYVYVANPDGTASVRNLTLGATDGQRREVKEGLVPGDKVVIDGIDRLRDGAKYKLPDATPPKAASGPREDEPKRKSGDDEPKRKGGKK